MPKSKQQKAEEMKQLSDNFTEAKSVVFTTFNGLSVTDAESLRNELRQSQVSFQAVKKTLLARVLNEGKLKDVDVSLESLEGSVAVAFGKEDEVAPARILAKFAKTNEALSIQGGILEGAYIAAEKVMALAKLPSRDELIAKTVWTIKGPISGFVNVMAGNLRNLVNVLNAVKEVKN